MYILFCFLFPEFGLLLLIMVVFFLVFSKEISLASQCRFKKKKQNNQNTAICALGIIIFIQCYSCNLPVFSSSRLRDSGPSVLALYLQQPASFLQTHIRHSAVYIYIFFFYHEIFSFSQSNLEMTVFEWKFPPVFISPVFHHLFCSLDLDKCNEGDLLTPFYKNSLVAQMVKRLPTIWGDLDSIPGSGRSPGEGNGNPLQYSCLENPMDRGTWWAKIHGVAKSQTWLSDFTLFL